jgi:hypothetical protein
MRSTTIKFALLITLGVIIAVDALPQHGSGADVGFKDFCDPENDGKYCIVGQGLTGDFMPN